jgi:hypothetical protein
MAAARTYFTTTHPSRSQPDPIASTFNFLFPVPYGPVKLSIKELSLGSNYSTIQVELEGQVMEKMRAVPDKRRTCTLATIIMGNLAGEKGMTLPTTPILRKEALPDRTHWIESIRPNSMRKVFPIVFKTRRWLGTTDPIVTKTLAEKSMRGLWTSRWDGKGWDVLELGFVCDLVTFPTAHSVKGPQLADNLIVPTSAVSLLPIQRASGVGYLMAHTVYGYGNQTRSQGLQVSLLEASYV